MNTEELNKQQKEAITAPLKPILVVAGAGTGKTTILVKRYEYLVKEYGISPNNILAIAFTKKAAQEMRKRIEQTINNLDLKNTYISTFHKFAKTLLESSGFSFAICFPKRTEYYIREIITEELKLSITNIKFATDIIRKIKWKIRTKDFTEADLVNIGKEITRFKESKVLDKFPYKEMKAVYNSYEKKLQKHNQLDFDDILLKANELLNNEQIREIWNQQFKAVLFDEFQDIDEIQFEIIKKLTEKEANIFCVGDPDQAIYGFRGALKNSFEEFKEHYKNAELFKLELNYRSTPQILETANTLINKNRGIFSKELNTNNPDGNKVSCYLAGEEDKYVVNTIIKLQTEEDIALKNCAVLYRNNSFGNQLTNLLLAKRIPFISRELYAFWRREEIKDMIAYLSVAFEKDAKKVDRALERVINKPNRGIGIKKQEILKNTAKVENISLREAITKSKDYAVKAFSELLNSLVNQELSIVEQVNNVLTKCGYWSYWSERDMEKYDRAKAILKNVLDEEKFDLDVIKKNIEEMTKYGVEKDQLYIGTIHGAKGLEFDYVFVIKLDEGKLPYKYSLEAEEERRLAYVAFTRAKKKLFLSSSGKVSPYIKELSNLLEFNP
ncbi:DNA helicase UvrD [Candidatus Mycoplasma haematobovis]|uniref:DNA 3'-5' helicase n=1 Tax=Candidatus Mycoplasma haematobovis TaxID=432608 RepID=A0A1A9QEK0_9MOLU|nr:ATP-dependent helicase [Candidatus Mycoplasma haematobovis]OAL10110.1 DNA helicase UvrD [Candidatus Mycoplasma haematobovis]